MAHSLYDWSVDAGVKKHVMIDHVSFIDYRQIPSEIQWVYLENITREKTLSRNILIEDANKSHTNPI